jgi:hypothetical protein
MDEANPPPSSPWPSGRLPAPPVFSPRSLVWWPSCSRLSTRPGSECLTLRETLGVVRALALPRGVDGPADGGEDGLMQVRHRWRPRQITAAQQYGTHGVVAKPLSQAAEKRSSSGPSTLSVVRPRHKSARTCPAVAAASAVTAASARALSRTNRKRASANDVVRERACQTPNQTVTTKAEQIRPSFTEQSPAKAEVLSRYIRRDLLCSRCARQSQRFKLRSIRRPGSPPHR